MREIPHIMKKARTQEGKALVLAYSILVSGGEGELEHYGVKVEEKGSGDCAQVLDVTMDAKSIYGLLDKLSRNTVTPTGLMDVLADWL